jgi:hypothetical protein
MNLKMSQFSSKTWEPLDCHNKEINKKFDDRWRCEDMWQQWNKKKNQTHRLLHTLLRNLYNVAK